MYEPPKLDRLDGDAIVYVPAHTLACLVGFVSGVVRQADAAGVKPLAGERVADAQLRAALATAVALLAQVPAKGTEP